MADILILFPPEKKMAAQQVAEALAAARYSARLVPIPAEGGEAALEALRGAGPAILIWSRALAASADIDGWLRPLRQARNLVEVSTDGIAPLGGDESRVVLLSGWRGQPYHLGWQRLLGQLEASGTARISAAAPAAVAPPQADPAVAADTRAAPERPANPKRRRVVSGLTLPAIAAAALVAAVAGAVWVIEKPAPNVQPADRPAVIAATAPAAAPTPLPPTGPEPVTTGEPASPPPEDTGDGAAPEHAFAPRARAEVPASKSVPKTSPAPVAPVVKRYSRRGSKMMRKFCARSGRNTLECRVFARSTGAIR